MRIIHRLVLGLVLVGSATSLGCSGCDIDGGWRRQNNGACPPGETCSDLTPNGLDFHGLRYSDATSNNDSVKALAIGGRQAIRITEPGSFGTFVRPYDALPTSGAITVVALSDNTFTVEGTGEGGAWVRVVDSRNGELYDMIDIPTASVDSFSVVPGYGDEVFVESDTNWALHAGGSYQVVVQVFGGGRRLVDANMTIAPETGDASTTVRQTAWDAADLTAHDVGTIFLSVTAGDASALVPVDVVDAIDEIARLPREFDWSGASAQVGRDYQLCFGGYLQTARVVPLDWSFSVQGPALIVPVSEAPNCVTFAASDTGTVTVSATAGGFTEQVTVEALPSN